MECPKCHKWRRPGHDAVCVPVTRRRVYVWVPEDTTRKERGLTIRGAKTIDIEPGVKQVWTMLGSEGTYTDPLSPPTMDPMTIVMEHGVTVLFEDQVSDWIQRGRTLHYFSRFTPGNVWILVEYHDPL